MSTPSPSAPKRPFEPGEAAPSFVQRNTSNPKYNFDTAAGRYLVLCFFGSAQDDHAKAALEAAYQRTDLFDDRKACFFGVSADPEDEAQGRVASRLPGFRHFWDGDLTAARLYRVAAEDGEPETLRQALVRQWVVIDPTMRIIEAIPFREDRSDIARFMEVMEGLPPPERHAGLELQAPILFLPRVFEPELCQELIDLYEDDGGEDSGFMREVGGRTVGIRDHSFKSRRDVTIKDQALISRLQSRVLHRVVPEIAKIHQFKVTRMERYIVSCYAADDGGHFSAHRDNTTKGTAHRRFAVSINLNDDFDGGEICFPEYGPRSFKPPKGGAVVFSCSLLHQVTKMTRGRRFAFLPFLYDDMAARIRAENAQFIDKPASQEKKDETVKADGPPA